MANIGTGEPYLPVSLCQWKKGVCKCIVSPEMHGIAQRTQIPRIGIQFQFLSLENLLLLDQVE